MSTPVIEPVTTRPARQPRILDRFRDADGFFHIIDEEGETILPPGTGPDQHGQGYTFGVNVDWQGGTAEIRWHSDDDAGNNRSYVWVGLYAHTSGFTTYGNAWFNMEANGSGYTGGNVSIGGSWVLIAARDTWIGHSADGSLNMTVGVHNGEVQGTSFNNAWGTNWVALTNYTVLPNPPFNLAVRSGSVTTSSFGVDYTRSTYDGVDQDQAQWATDPGFANVVSTTNPGGGGNGSGGYATPGVALTPGTTHYFRVRSHTAAGWGGWSGTVTQATLPAVPPGFTVSSSPSGTQASLAFTPPGGVTGVAKYAWERRATGSTSPVTAGETTSNAAVITGLTPGASYDWRASAFIGTYQSPWTEWTTLVQAKPNINPGDYFDGSTADTGDLDYGWTGAANASTSVATAKGVAGWGVTFASGMSGVMYRVTAGIFGAYAARLQIHTDSATPGAIHVGQAWTVADMTEVTEGATYIGSIHVRPSRSQNLSATILWLDAAGTFLSSSTGAGTVVPGSSWLRLVAGGVAPAGAKGAIIRMIDVAGTGWSGWQGGDTVDLDGAMISLNEEFPYFDGSFLPDSNYVYEWTEDAHASPSTRTPVAQAQAGAFMPELGGLFLPARLALTDPNCAVVPLPPRPPIVDSECIEDVGVWRRYYTQIPANLVPDWLDVVPTLEITSAALAAKQVRIRYYANPTGASPGQVDTTTWLSEQIVSFMPAHTVLTLDGVTQHVWAEVNGSEPIGADHLLYGTNGKPATWPVLSCGIAYLVSIDVPIAEPAGNIVIAASLTARS